MFRTSDGNVQSNNDFALVRYNPDGSHDYSFGTAGKVLTEFGSTDDEGNAIAIQENGGILVTGSSSQNFRGLGLQIAVARYDGVSTRVDELEGLTLRVQELSAAGRLNDGQAQSLQTKLRAAIQQVDRGNYATAVNQLGAFANEIDALVSGDVLSVPEGEVLRDEVQRIAELVSG